MMPYLLGMFSCVHEPCGQPGPLSPEDEAKWEWAMNNPDYRMYAHLWNILTQKGQRQGMTFWTLIDPYDYPELAREERGGLPEGQDPLRVRLGRLRLHLQDALAGRPALVHERAELAEEAAALQRARPHGAPLPRDARRHHPLVRPLAEGHR